MTYHEMRAKIVSTQIYFQTRENFYSRSSFKFNYNEISNAVNSLTEAELFDIYSRMCVLYEKIDILLYEDAKYAVNKFYTHLCQNVLDITKDTNEKGNMNFGGYFVTENFFTALPHWTIKVICKPHYLDFS